MNAKLKSGRIDHLAGIVADRDHLRERVKELEEALGDLLSAVEHNLSTGTERHKARILLSKSPK